MSTTPVSQFTVYERPSPTPKVYDFNIVGPVKDPTHYIDLLQVMRVAQEGDVLNLYMNTPGGDVTAMIQIINGMRNTKAEVIAHLEGECHSAGTFIFLSADSWVVNPNCILLFHSYSSGMWGEGHKLLSEAISVDKWLKQICDDIYRPFLTVEEIDAINSGQDLWLDSEEVVTRLEKVTEYREQLEVKEMERVQQAIRDAVAEQTPEKPKKKKKKD